MADHASKRDMHSRSRNLELQQPDDHLISPCAEALNVQADNIDDAYPMTPFQSHMAAENLASRTWVASYAFYCQDATFEYLAEVIEVLQRRHAVLRAHILQVDGRFYQAVTRNVSEFETFTSTKDYLDDVRGRPMPLGSRALLLGYGNSESVTIFILTLGHVVMDE
ncbi:hypothetical protein CLAFUW4_10060 [Fulvia fulva]|uniref:Condensation domain-containing protein n=1 Tax=Passalora fulva TaxID=5499 RepID=A0A9Q8UU90_PASFU|nr:uncharacterized protein CLAFUR5_12185 [Fulvia fulva]KAK4616151.1 hypothetical protein CLAFUR4_10064 [Fulvia fulva]KAK4617022.1 hypothetical protein CLAFUR0_10062 [Fulvia fulva]UJO22645.1 hypothetical protein CLAFUR5_12185 [Fulvia fulva]WPV19452.1 hypothetical protein CLAFUW4_10060 [Fulvia fulva]WPV33664.1 hypothetical protein CLAFUW7_10061 [Fulvia fulva]